MAGFKTHITTAAVVGTAYGTAGHLLYQVPLPTCVLSGGLCTLAGILPDVDSETGVTLRELLAFVAAVVPMLLIDRFRQLQVEQELIVLASGLLYLLIRFVCGEFVRRHTIHRGMWHSIPAALIAALVIFNICVGPDIWTRCFKAVAVLIGYLWHLILDEFFSVETRAGRVRVKRSFGTALKMWGRHPFANIATYAALVALIAGFPVKPQGGASSPAGQPPEPTERSADRGVPPDLPELFPR